MKPEHRRNLEGNSDPNRNLNRMRVGQYYLEKKSCYKCGSLRISHGMREVFKKMTDVYLCLDCDAFFLDVDQLYRLQYGYKK